MAASSIVLPSEGFHSNEKWATSSLLEQRSPASTTPLRSKTLSVLAFRRFSTLESQFSSSLLYQFPYCGVLRLCSSTQSVPSGPMVPPSSVLFTSRTNSIIGVARSSTVCGRVNFNSRKNASSISRRHFSTTSNWCHSFVDSFKINQLMHSSVFQQSSNYKTLAPIAFTRNLSQRFISRYAEVKSLSTSARPTADPTTPSESGSSLVSSKFPPKSRTWIRIARTIKTIRIPFLVLTVFGVGYNQGKIDYARDPEGEQELLLVTVLAGVGATPSNRLISPLDPRIHQVQRVGKRITKVAASHVYQQMEKCITNCSNKLEQAEVEVNEESMRKLLQTDKESIKWALAEKHVSGSWEYYVIESPIPNAFVSEILPKKIFVTTSMIERFIHNDDEMALILGHELSHLILGHVSKSNTLETFLRALEVLLLSVDPTEGAASLVMMFIYWIMRKLIGAAHSQENEREADELGIKLAAMACYDTKLASEVFEKIHQYEQTGGTSVDQDGAVVQGRERRAASIDWFDSHPPVKERYEFLVAESDVENKDKYMNDECYTVKGRLMNLLQRSKVKPNEEKEPSPVSSE